MGNCMISGLIMQILDYGDLSYLLQEEYDRQLVAMSQDAELMSPPIGTRGLVHGKVSLHFAFLHCIDIAATYDVTFLPFSHVWCHIFNPSITLSLLVDVARRTNTFCML